MKIVIVEDEIIIREGIVKLIQRANKSHEIVGQASNGKAGIRLIQEKKPDVVITDIRMPEMDGLEMLQEVRKSNISTKAIILSAYSEFAYAQKAVKLGVSEYILKPISVGEFTQSLKNIENQLEQDSRVRTNHPEMLHTVENVLYGILLSGLPVNDELLAFLSGTYHMDTTHSFLLMLNYLGSQYSGKKDKMKKTMSLCLSLKNNINYCILELPKSQELLVFVYSFQDANEIERWFQHTVLPRIRGELDFYGCFGLTEFQNLLNFKEGYDQLHKCMDWNIILGDDIIVSYPKVAKIQTVPLSYPIDIESRMRAALCAADTKKIKKECLAFEEYFKRGEINAVKEIKDSFVRFLWNIINVSKEIDFVQYQKLEKSECIERIMSAITWDELKDVLDTVVQLLNIYTPKAEKLSFVVQRAKSLAHEFYAQGITLDEIALQLKITPEYLSTQFHREVGTNFSSYIKNYRIGKAKELLLGTELKLYQISEKVGYKDPKHFSKVFYEIVGEMPAEYRKLHK